MTDIDNPIFSATPVVVTDPDQCTCQKCGKSDQGYQRCSKCKEVYYCSRECQKDDWKTHKKICGSLSALLDVTVQGLAGVSGNMVAGVFAGDKLLGRTEAAAKGAKGVAFARCLQVTSPLEATVSVYAVNTDAKVTKETHVGSALVKFTGKEDGSTYPLLKTDGSASGSTLRLDQKGSGKDKFAGVKASNATESKTAPEPLPSGPLWDGDFPGADTSNYKTYDNDTVHGFKIPSLDTMSIVNKDAGYPLPKVGAPMLLLFWAQYSKSGFKFMPLYSKLSQRYGERCPIVGVSVDADESSSAKFLEDPGKKYSSVFPTNFTVGHDKGGVLKEAFTSGLRDTLNICHAFLVDKTGTVVWHQDHSQIGATAPTFMNLMETQVKSLLETGKVTSVGAKEVGSDSDSDEGDEGDTMDIGEEMDLF